MKLSMWMIANRLSSLDLELNIAENAPAVLNSARRAYATNCVHVYQSGDCVVCNGEGNMIRIRNITETQAFEIVQSVFDYYQDWYDQITALARAMDYQALVDYAWQAFQNPLLLFDDNKRVLGISRKYDLSEMDPEWDYLCQYGYPSINSAQEIRYDYGHAFFSDHGMRLYHFHRSQQMKFDGASYCLSYNDMVCGRINLLAKSRPLNTGDYQLLRVMADILEPILGQSNNKDFRYNFVFYNVLFSKPYDEEMLDLQLRFQSWKRTDVYQLALIELPQDEDSENERHSTLNLMLYTSSKRLSNYIVLRRKPYVLIFSNREFTNDPEFLQFQQAITANNALQVGLSLPCSGIAEARYLFDQARGAIRFGNLRAPAQSQYLFFDYAIDYILTASSFTDSLHACCPAVRGIWEMCRENGREMFDTLRTYLDNERSVTKTSAVLFTHRNTVLYRIKKIQELLGQDLDDAYIRDYVRLSIRVLELSEKMRGEQ